MKVHIDTALCTGCGSCEEICPEVFQLIDDIAVNLLGEESVIPDQYKDGCREAADSCPVDAIIIVE